MLSTNNYRSNARRQQSSQPSSPSSRRPLSSNNNNNNNHGNKHKWNTLFQTFFICNAIGLILFLIALQIYKPTSMERAKQVDVELVSPLSHELESCIKDQKNPADIKKTLDLIDYIAKTKKTSLAFTAVPNYNGYTILLGIALGFNIITLLNMEFPYSLCCCGYNSCFKKRNNNNNRPFDLPEPLFAYPTISILRGNYLPKFLLLLCSFIVSLTTEIESKQPDCDDIISVTTRKHLESIYGDKVDSITLAKDYCKVLHQNCKVSINIKFLSTDTPNISLLLLMISSIFICLICVIKWYVWVKFVSDLVEFEENDNNYSNLLDGNANQAVNGNNNNARLISIRRSTRISRLLAGRNIDANRQRLLDEEQQNGLPRAGRFINNNNNNNNINERNVVPNRNPNRNPINTMQDDNNNSRRNSGGSNHRMKNNKSKYHVNHNLKNMETHVISHNEKKQYNNNNNNNLKTNVEEDTPNSKKDTSDSNTSNINCVICLDNIDINSTVAQEQIKCLPCGHVFHECCIEEWFTSKKNNAFSNEEVKLNCPVCRHTAR